MAEWRPNPGPQTEALRANEFETLYGGARGGGKTDAGLAWLTRHVDNPNYRALVIRRNADDLSDWVDRASKMYSGLGADIAYRPAEIRFPSGAMIKTGHLKDDQAYTKYQGHEYQRMLIEELTQIPTEKRYLQLIASCRSTVPDIPARVFGTTNPGGLGHYWVMKRWRIDDLEQWGTRFYGPDSERTRIFIPAKLDDNPKLMQADPEYEKTLNELQVVDPELYKAWRLGRWDIVAGQAFREWDATKHIILGEMPYSLSDCEKIIGFDGGYTDPACAIFLAYTPENQYGVRRIIAYRELYENKLTPQQWAERLKVYTDIDDIQYLALPHDAFANRDGGQTIAETFRQIGVRQVAVPSMGRGARINRKALLHQYLADAPDGRPYFQIKPSCKNLIRTIPLIPIDDNNVEDIDTDSEDHAYDALTYAFLTKRIKIASGEVMGRVVKDTKKVVWNPDKQGNIHGPDWWTKFKEDQQPTGSVNPEFM